ncbi:hypothetical protein QEH56_23945 [Pelagicoccus enzymogenes]|uniref:hypothetical protein n=1 Tax=Pelagicoccus enzymogenes TaxID=2773457 RepID=UPI00280F0797|nr:hypothetical protein [Pelagicoccus enzymogenes]MDQ8201238.1 hypothetical protein [Pelagicoccus enzymogenes]
MDKEWLKTNLEEARDWIEHAIKEIDRLEDDDELPAQQLIGEAYIKLNQAWNSRNGPDSAKGKYRDMIVYPKVMNMYAE